MVKTYEHFSCIYIYICRYYKQLSQDQPSHREMVIAGNIINKNFARFPPSHLPNVQPDPSQQPGQAAEIRLRGERGEEQCEAKTDTTQSGEVGGNHRETRGSR